MAADKSISTQQAADSKQQAADSKRSEGKPSIGSRVSKYTHYDKLQG